MNAEEKKTVLGILKSDIPESLDSKTSFTIRKFTSRDNGFEMEVGLTTTNDQGLDQSFIWFYANEFDQETVKGPWLRSEYEQWRNENSIMDFRDGRHTNKPKKRERKTEGHLFDIDCSSSIERFTEWGKRFVSFLESIPDRWNKHGRQWNRDNTSKVKNWINEISDTATPSLSPDPSKHEFEPDMNPAPKETLLSFHQRLLFGAPGTGKSHQLKIEVKELFAERYERVTFYPTYSYAQFVGTYKPVMEIGKDADCGRIVYRFVPGPFLRVLVDALKDRKDHCLVVEEINRATAAAVFGDVFQLLDRGGTWDVKEDETPEELKLFFKNGGASEYDVAVSEDIKHYLQMELDDAKNPNAFEEALRFLKVREGKGESAKNDWSKCRLRIPANMYIWATMNSADQGVNPMDTAFKRRWEFEYIGIDEGWDKSNNGKHAPKDWTIGARGYNWNDIRKLTNRLLSLRRVNEDKLMGPFFVKPTIESNGKSIISDDAFCSKVLMYLWEDAAKMWRRQLFGDSIETFSGLIRAWNNIGVQVFEKDTNLGNPGDSEAKKLYDQLNQNLLKKPIDSLKAQNAREGTDKGASPNG